MLPSVFTIGTMGAAHSESVTGNIVPAACSRSVSPTTELSLRYFDIAPVGGHVVW